MNDNSHLVTPALAVRRRGALAAGAGVAFGVAGMVAPAPVVEAAEVSRIGWRFCQKCRGMFLTPKGKPLGVCPAGGKHKAQGKTYVLDRGLNPGAPVVTGFARCRKCAGLYHGRSETVRPWGSCPKGGLHDPASTTAIGMSYEDPIPGMMENSWHLCDACEALFNAGGGFRGACPANQDGHVRNIVEYSIVILC